jgi:hypothetical protein
LQLLPPFLDNTLDKLIDRPQDRGRRRFNDR